MGRGFFDCAYSVRNFDGIFRFLEFLHHFLTISGHGRMLPYQNVDITAIDRRGREGMEVSPTHSMKWKRVRTVTMSCVGAGENRYQNGRSFGRDPGPLPIFFSIGVQRKTLENCLQIIWILTTLYEFYCKIIKNFKLSVNPNYFTYIGLISSPRPF